jgi:hypothetical protein
MTTGQVVQQVLADTSRWDCLAAGLTAAEGDDVRVTFIGRAEADWLNVPVDDTRGLRVPESDAVSPNIIVDPLVVDMGIIDAIHEEWAAGVLVTNDNDVAITFLEVAASDPLAEPFFVEVDRLSLSTCNPNRQCTSGDLDIGLRALVPGEYSDTFSITSTDPVTPVVTVQVHATVLADRNTATMIGARNFNGTVTCWNVTTGQRFSYRSPGVDCTRRGLKTSANDRVIVSFSAIKDDDP